MKNYLILFAFICSANVTFAQSESSDKGSQLLTKTVEKSSKKSVKQPMFIIDGYRMDSTVLMKDVNADIIKSMAVITDKAEMAKYGDKEGYGVIVIKTKNPNDKKLKSLLKKSGQKVVFDK